MLTSAELALEAEAARQAGLEARRVGGLRLKGLERAVPAFLLD